jgi:acetylornithine/succinyldiaminopimelate/putrescine aminotransferase
MLAVDLGRPSGPALDALVAEGVIAIAAGPTGIRLLPPLVVRREDLEFALRALARAVAA